MTETRKIDKKFHPGLFVVQWCPICERDRKCKVVSNYYIKCGTCHVKILLAAVVSRLFRVKEALNEKTLHMPSSGGT